jgi:hypothetical protein
MKLAKDSVPVQAGERNEANKFKKNESENARPGEYDSTAIHARELAKNTRIAGGLSLRANLRNGCPNR